MKTPKTKIALVLAVIMLLVLIQCTSAKQSAKSEIKYEQFFISHEEVQKSNYANPYDFVHVVRPSWFIKDASRTSVKRNSRGKRDYPDVYVNSLKCGKLGYLRKISMTKVLEIEYIQPDEARNRFGVDHFGGIIQVRTLK